MDEEIVDVREHQANRGPIRANSDLAGAPVRVECAAHKSSSDRVVSHGTRKILIVKGHPAEDRRAYPACYCWRVGGAHGEADVPQFGSGDRVDAS